MVFCSIFSSGRLSQAICTSAFDVTAGAAIFSLSSSARVMGSPTGSPQSWQSSIFESTSPSLTLVQAISASFTLTLTLSPSLLVATPS